MKNLVLGLSALCLSAGAAFGREPIVELKVAPERAAFANLTWDKPAVIKSADDAAKYFGEDALAAIAKQVDFDKQVVLLFAWRGSGGDKLEYSVLESSPEQIPFSLQRGRTRDLRTHSRVFALAADVKWSIK